MRKLYILIPVAVLVLVAVRTAVTPVQPSDSISQLDERVEVLEREASATSAPVPVRGPVDWEPLTRRALPSVVQIRASGSVSDSAGSGAIISNKGLIITANHVISDDGGRPAKRIFIDYSDGSSATATLLGRAPEHDLALLRAPLPEGGQPIAIASKTPATGSPAAVLGAPFGRAKSLSVGVISATGRTLSSKSGFRINDAIQTDAPVNRGNSGGPLIDPAGRLLGVVAQLETDTGASSGVGFAISSATLSALLERMIAGEEFHPGFAGITALDVTAQLSDELELGTDTGALVQAISKDSGAARAGLRQPSGLRDLYGEQIAVGGEVITAVDGVAVRSAADLAQQVSLHAPGETVTLTARSKMSSRSVTVTLQKRPGA